MDETQLAPYAARADNCRGRLYAEQESAHRSPFQRDRDRIIHSSAFRRLKHKTQVFVEHEGDYYRTRLTHSIEVAQIARTIARTLRLNEDLTEAVALAHDLGHTPFGHTGEDALADCMAGYGGFDHNAQALKIVTALEKHYAEFDGLNLTWETLEGIAKHNGPLLSAPDSPNDALPVAIAEYTARHDLELHTHASAEAQVAALSDDIAYVNHDLHDGLRAGLFTLEAAMALPVVGDCFAEVDAAYPGLEPLRRRHEALRRVFGLMVDDVLAESRHRLEAHAPASMAAVQALDAPVITFSGSMGSAIETIKAFLFRHMYRHYKVRRMRAKASGVVRDLFDVFLNDPGLMPVE
jgi:dGTPase